MRICRIVAELHSPYTCTSTNSHTHSNAAGMVTNPNVQRSTLEPCNDPWLAEQAYRVALKAANRHSEFYMKVCVILLVVLVCVCDVINLCKQSHNC
jgi:flagellar basal body rod protein FlgC